MTDENDKKPSKPSPAIDEKAADHATGVGPAVKDPDAPLKSERPGTPPPEGELAQPPASSASGTEHAKPTAGSEASTREEKLAADARDVHEAQIATRAEHIDHTLAQKPLKPAHSVRVKLLYADGGVAHAETENETYQGDVPPEEANEVKPALLLAEYATPGEVMHAAESFRDAGYTVFDTHTPFPVHGMDRAMGLPDSRLGWIVLAMGLTGVSCGWLMIWWMNGVDYPIIIGGKPAYSLPSMIPIMFELTILLSAFGAVFGMFGLNKLPRHHHPIFHSDRFASFSNDRFFLSVEATDPKFHLERTRDLLEKSHPAAIELIEDEVES
jgi:hypothetical protein